jgi:hypothetical protein
MGPAGHPAKRSVKPVPTAAEEGKVGKSAGKPANQPARRTAKTDLKTTGQKATGPSSAKLELKGTAGAFAASSQKTANKKTAVSDVLAAKTRTRPGTKPAAASARTGAGKTSAPASPKAATKPGVKPTGKILASDPAPMGRTPKPQTTVGKKPAAGAKPKARLAASMAAPAAGAQKPRPPASTKPAASAPKSKPSAGPSSAGKATSGGKSKASPAAAKTAPQTGGKPSRTKKPAGQLTLPELDQGSGTKPAQKKTGTKTRGKS